MKYLDKDKLKRTDKNELKTVSKLVAQLFGEFDPRVEIRDVYFYDERSPCTIYLSEDSRFPHPIWCANIAPCSLR